jgi:hypothetical protein
MPVLLPAARRYWEAWQLLDACRLRNGDDPQPLQLTELRAGAAHFAFESYAATFTFVQLMRELDATYLAFIRDEKRKKKPPPKR